MVMPVNPGQEITEGIISAQTKVIDGVGTEHQALSDTDGTQFQKEKFSGAVYENQITLTDDDPTRFETSEKILLDVLIYVETYDALFGNVTNQRLSRAAGAVFGFTKVDISTLYFKNKTAGQNTKVTILGTEL